MVWAQRHAQETGQAALPGYSPAFTATFGPWDLTVLESGEVVPCLGYVLHEGGLDGVRKIGPKTSDVDESGALLNAQRSNRQIVPHEMTVLAFGEERRGYLGHTVAGIDEQPYRGTQGEYWTDAWRRVRWVHGQPRWDVDADGYLDFHRRVLKHFCPQGLDADQIAAAEQRSGRLAGPGGKARPADVPTSPTPSDPTPDKPAKTRGK